MTIPLIFLYIHTSSRLHGQENAWPYRRTVGGPNAFRGGGGFCLLRHVGPGNGSQVKRVSFDTEHLYLCRTNGVCSLLVLPMRLISDLLEYCTSETSVLRCGPVAGSEHPSHTCICERCNPDVCSTSSPKLSRICFRGYCLKVRPLV